MPRSAPQIQFRLRFPNSSPEAFGPGKSELLRLIAATGSISEAAAEMDMSYNRAWTLVRDMNALFREPLVSSARGGGTGGGAALTPAGEKVLKLYLHMEASCEKATRKDWAALVRMLA